MKKYVLQELWYTLSDQDADAFKKAWAKFDEGSPTYSKLQQCLSEHEIVSGSEFEMIIYSYLPQNKGIRLFKVPLMVEDHRNFWARLFNIKLHLCQNS